MTGGGGGQPTLRGRLTALRPWTEPDIDFIFDACQDPDIQRWTTVPSPYGRQDAVDYVHEIAPGAWTDGGGVFAVVDASERPVGSIGCHGLRDGIGEVGYWTAREHRGHGYTADALRTLAYWLLDHRGAERVELFAEPDNAGSRRVAEAGGFVPEGTLRHRLWLKGRRADVVMYSLIGTDARR